MGLGSYLMFYLNRLECCEFKMLNLILLFREIDYGEIFRLWKWKLQKIKNSLDCLLHDEENNESLNLSSNFGFGIYI